MSRRERYAAAERAGAHFSVARVQQRGRGSDHAGVQLVPALMVAEQGARVPLEGAVRPLQVYMVQLGEPLSTPVAEQEYAAPL